jgi:hypothetical protein
LGGSLRVQVRIVGQAKEVLPNRRTSITRESKSLEHA